MAGGEVTNPSGTAKLHEYWVHGPGAAKIRWGVPGDFDRCVMHLGKYVRDPKGLCANLHHAALGVWPGQEHGGKKGRSMADERVGPKGYVHGWIYVGTGGLGAGHGLKPGDRVKAHHNVYGDVEGTVTSVHKNGNLIATVNQSKLFGTKDLPGIALHRKSVTHVGRETSAHLGSVTHKGRSAEGITGMDSDRADSKPYGNVTYADPKNGKYPIDTAAHAKAAWSYINMPKNAAQYPMNGVTLSEVKGRIKAACKKFGIETSDSNSAEIPGEVRTVPFDVASTEANGDGLTFEGYAAVYDTPTRIQGRDEDFDEQISPGAFRAIAAGQYPVLMFDHGKHPLIGSMPLGRITGAREDPNGLFITARLTDNWLIQPVRDAIADRALTGMSFRFMVDDDGESWDRSRDVPLRTLTSVTVPELGPVVFPAYEPTTASVRSALDNLELPVIGRPPAGAMAATDRDGGQPGHGNPSALLSARFRRDGEALALRGIEGITI